MSGWMVEGGGGVCCVCGNEKTKERAVQILLQCMEGRGRSKMFFLGRGLLTNKGEDQYMQKNVQDVLLLLLLLICKTRGKPSLSVYICLPVRLRLPS